MSSAPTTTRNQWFQNEWAPRVEQDTQGRVKVTFYWAETLGKVSDWWDMVTSGVCDVADIKPAFYHGTFPLNEDYDIPFLYPWDDPWKCLEIRQALWDKYYGPEFSDVHVLHIWISGAVDLICKPKLIKTQEDFKGLQMGGPQGPLSMGLQALGATPAGMVMTEAYMNIDRGVIDGFALPSHTFIDLKWVDLAKNVTIADMAGGLFPLCMNMDTWNKLLPQDQKAFEEIGKWATQEYSQLTLDEDVEANNYFKENGINLYFLPQEEKDRWAETTKGVMDQFAANLDKQGKPGTELINAVLQLKAQP